MSKQNKSERIYLRIKPELKKEIQEFAESKGIPVSNLMTIWVTERLQIEKRKQIDLDKYL